MLRGVVFRLLGMVGGALACLMVIAMGAAMMHGEKKKARGAAVTKSGWLSPMIDSLEEAVLATQRKIEEMRSLDRRARAG